VETLERVRSKIDASSQVWVSSPSESTADVTHLAGLAFNAPTAKEWLQRQGSDAEEDVVAELLAASIQERGSLPSHAPGASECSTAVGDSSENPTSERDSESASPDALEEAQREETLRKYPRPAWLEKPEGTMNIGVVGNSGVGKSLFINRLRGLRHFDEGWAPVGINETTTQVSMYAFPSERRVRLWDFPGAGTENFPLETYVARMGLRYLDSVLLVTAGRFTQTEVKLMRELQDFRVPYFLVRTKVDLDVMNNRHDNSASEADSLAEIRHDLKAERGVEDKVYLVSLRDPKKYDYMELVEAIFPCLAARPSLGEGWDDPWQLPEVYSPTLEALQGSWTDSKGTTYIVKGRGLHITNFLLGCSVVDLEESSEGSIVWPQGYRVDMTSIAHWRSSGKLLWQAFPESQHCTKPRMEWKFQS